MALTDARYTPGKSHNDRLVTDDISVHTSLRLHNGATMSGNGALKMHNSSSVINGPMYVQARTTLSQVLNTTVDKTAASTSILRVGTSSGAARWEIQAYNSETGSDNVGSDLRIARFDDAGDVLSYPLRVSRATGVVSVDRISAGTFVPRYTVSAGVAMTDGAVTVAYHAVNYPILGSLTTDAVIIAMPVGTLIQNPGDVETPTNSFGVVTAAMELDETPTNNKLHFQSTNAIDDRDVMFHILRL
jgi:hypothetical protein